MRLVLLALAFGAGLTACHDADHAAALTEDVRSPSVARIWNEVLLEGIRNDNARPTVHSRNLWHASAAMYDAWAAYDDTAATWLLGKTQNGYDCEFPEPRFPADRHVAREKAISYAAYRLIRHRFQHAPGADYILQLADDTMAELGYDINDTGTNYALGSPSALGNHVAECYIAYGLSDGANEENNYAAIDYVPFNPPIEAEKPGNPDIIDLNRWQQLTLTLSIDQSGHVVEKTPPFVGPEWGGVHPFSLTEADKTICSRPGFSYPVYHDPGPPPMTTSYPDEYKYTFSLNAVWSGHMSTTKGHGAELIDISPATIGNIQSYPRTFAEHHGFYDLLQGGSPETGYDFNPTTGQPYEPQLVPLADYARTIVDFWSDGPASETPPGHWFVIANTVNDHPMLVRRFEGTGPELGPLEWDVKLYFALGGAVHDAAITAWGIKGCYDYVRPISAIRAMADRGQSTDPDDPDCPYHPDGIPYIDDPSDPAADGSKRVIDCVRAGDPLADDPGTPGIDANNVGKIKLWAWRGPEYISNPNFDVADVDWILAEDWWPHFPITFVTPPFAGYISGHSTFSRTAAEVLALFTGDPFFPGGKSEFEAPAHQFLETEDGPSVDLVLEWAKYTDASDQCSLSRIWGGIHPPADDMPGRLIGMQLGPEVFEHARDYFEGRD